MLSDRIGRKRVIYIGLLLMALGSLICAAADNIYLMILGRAVQGAGRFRRHHRAAGGSDPRRTPHPAMAMIGMSIGLTFAVSLAAGPTLYKTDDHAGIFVLIGVPRWRLCWRAENRAAAICRVSIPTLKPTRPSCARVARSATAAAELRHFALHASKWRCSRSCR